MPEQASAADGATVPSDDAKVARGVAAQNAAVTVSGVGPSGAVMVNGVVPNAAAMRSGAVMVNVVVPSAAVMPSGAEMENADVLSAVAMPSGNGHLNAAAGPSAAVTVSAAVMANVVVLNAVVRLNVGVARSGAGIAVRTVAGIAVAQNVASIVCRQSLFALARVVAHRGWLARSVAWSAKSAPRFVMAT
ncbi:MAG: hypothetical protein AAGG99_02185 [Pseudomonadota bacterium]